MPIYKEPTWDLLDKCIREHPSPMTRQGIVDWFKQNYPRTKSSTVSAHITSCCVNDPNRRHFGNGGRVGRAGAVLFREADARYVAYAEGKHGRFTREGQPEDEVSEERDSLDEPAQQEQPEFILEKYLEEFIYQNWNRIDFGRPLTLYHDEHGRDGRQWDTGEIGRLDFLCTDKADGSFVVIELKKGRPTDRVIGQLQRYMGWVAENLANGRGVSGIVITPSVADLHLQYALLVTRNIDWKCYEFTFKLAEPPADS